MLIEALTMGIGVSVAKAMARLWLGEQPLVEAAVTPIIEILGRRIGDFEARRGAEKVLNNLPDEVARRLAPVIEAEFPQLEENERCAAVYAIGNVLDGLCLDQDLIEADLDAAKLELRLRPLASEFYLGLSAASVELARLLLRECCNYVVRLAQAMPKLQAAATREHLKREREMLQMLTKVLDQLSAIRSTADAVRTGENSSFELQYRRSLIARLDRMELFGLRLIGGGAYEYPLSVAYVTLSAVQGGVLNPGRVDQLLGTHQYTLVRGEAGSGKTTLLRWLAIRCASRDITGALSAWNKRLPCYIRLRDYAREGRDLPVPEQFLEGCAKNLAGEQPRSWMQNACRAGALLLVDGIDELPADKRRRFPDWLRQIKSDFPHTAVVLSSRPAAVDTERDHTGRRLADVLEDMGFTPIALEPMSLQDSYALVAQWHAAVARERESERDFLAKFERELRNTLRERPAIRNLATNPLLCAMVCALNWDRKQHLPNDRMLLYQAALDLLLDQRDAARGVPDASLRLEKSEKEALLDGIAYWMVRNGHVEADISAVEQEVSRQLSRLPRIALAPAEQLVQELLERTGVLRRPQHGVIDFIHRTFLEYMGARAAIRAGDIGFLQDRARDEWWREVIVFAVGHAQGRERDHLVRGLLRKPLFRELSVEAAVVAACCLETAAQNLAPELLVALQALARRLFPPRTLEAAALLAPAAALEPDLLEGHVAGGPVTIAACIRTAAIVGGTRMLDVIAQYAEFPDSDIDEEIVRAWDAYDDDEFARRIKRCRNMLLGQKVRELDDESLLCFRLLVARGVHRRGAAALQSALDDFRCRRVLDLSTKELAPPPVRSIWPQVERVEHGSTGPLRSSDARRLSRLPSLRGVSVEVDNISLPFIAGLQTLEKLSLYFSGHQRSVNLTPLLSCSKLQDLALFEATAADIAVLRQLSTLRILRIDSCGCSGLSGLAYSSIERLDLIDLEVHEVDWLRTLGRLTSLRVSGCGKLRIPFEALRSLESFFGDAELTEALHLAPNLQKVTLFAGDVATFAPRLPAACYQLELNGGIIDCSALARHPRLRTIACREVRELRQVDVLMTIPHLQELDLVRCQTLDATSVAAALRTRKLTSDAHGTAPKSVLAASSET